MSSGPSKEELEMYWKSSRQYFDELANYYRTADPAYYNEYIAPFYSNPFNTVSAGRQGSSRGVKAVFVSVFTSVILVVIGMAVFLLSSNDSVDFKKVEKIFESSDDKDIKENTKPSENDEKNVLPDDEFIIGAKYLAEKDYDKAEQHLKKVKKDDKYYKEAQELLKNIKYLRKYDNPKNK